MSLGSFHLSHFGQNSLTLAILAREVVILKVRAVVTLIEKVVAVSLKFGMLLSK